MKKQIMFGLLVAATAVGISAFTSAPVKRAEGDQFGRNSSGNYVMISGYNVNNCSAAAGGICAYQVTAEGADIVTAPFSATQAEEWEDAGYLDRLTNNQGVYQ